MSSGDATALATTARADRLGAIRDQIDAVDSQLVPLLAARLRLVVSAAGCKNDLASVADPGRVEAVLEGIRGHAEMCSSDSLTIEVIYRTIIEHGIELERDAYARHPNGAPVPSDPPLAPAALNGAGAVHLLHVMATMRAMRRLDSRPISPELLETLVAAASWAPVGANRQCYRFLAVTDRQTIARLASHWQKAMQFYVDALRPAAGEQEAEQAERVRAAMTYQAEHFTELPAVIVACYEPVSFWRRLLADPRRAGQHLRTLRPSDRWQVLTNLKSWAARASAASVYPAVENLLLAARAHGLGATLTTWHSAFEKDFKRVLGIPPNVGIYAIVPIGYPLGRFGPVRRRPVAELLSMDRWPDD